MKKLLIVCLFSTFAMAGTTFAADGGDATAACTQRAQEEGVSAEEMDAYMQECIKEMTSGGE